MTKLYFYDTDICTDSLDTAYTHTDHSVWMTFIPNYVSGYDQVAWMGLLFGQAYKLTGLSNIGTKTFTY